MYNKYNAAQTKRDQYYSYLFKKYNCYDIDIIDNIISTEENEIREQLELGAM